MTTKGLHGERLEEKKNDIKGKRVGNLNHMVSY